MVLLVACQPDVTSFADTSGPVGSSVVITGTGFTHATRVTFNGAPAAYTVTNDRSIAAVVPPLSTAGPISVTATNLTGVSSTAYNVTGGGPTLTSASSIVSGGDYSCSLVTGGAAKCWGDVPGALPGSGLRLTPSDVAGLSGVTQLAAGAEFACALASGGVSCWGYNSYGALGNGTLTDSETNPTPVAGVANATQISAGWAHACALISGGTIKCWGADSSGQLGDQTDGDGNGVRLAPVSVVGITNAVQVAAGVDFTCARLATGTVECWGNSSDGRLGSPTAGGFSLVPLVVPGVTGATDLSTGGSHACAVVTGGQVMCWGGNYLGQLGAGNTDVQTQPVTVAGISGATAVAAGGVLTCAIRGDASVACWGSNTAHELGDWRAADPSPSPVTPLGVAGASRISVGSGHACALVTGSHVMCWGDDINAQLGSGGNFERWQPVAVLP